MLCNFKHTYTSNLVNALCSNHSCSWLVVVIFKKSLDLFAVDAYYYSMKKYISGSFMRQMKPNLCIVRFTAMLYCLHLEKRKRQILCLRIGSFQGNVVYFLRQDDDFLCAFYQENLVFQIFYS